MTKPLPLNLRDGNAIIPLAQGGFSTSLKYSDRMKLHGILKKVHLSYMPGHMLDAYECDKLLDAFGPKVWETLLRQAAEAGV